MRAPQRQLLPPVRHCSVFHGDALLQQTGAQSVSNTPPPTGTSGFTHQDLVLGTTRPQRAPERSHHFLPWGHLAPTLGCEGRMCPSLTCVGRGPGGRWLCADTPGESSPWALMGSQPPPDTRGICPDTEGPAPRTPGRVSILGRRFQGRPRAQRGDTENLNMATRGRGLAVGLGESLTIGDPALLTWY